MTKISDLSTKTAPVGADLLNGLDSEDSNVNTKNKNLTVDSIGTTVFGDRSTSDLSEGTNEYYTTAKVITDTANKAEKDNVLELDNTIPYAPTADYHPVTKKYLEDQPYPDASETVKGIAEIATTAEAETKTADDKIMTPLKTSDAIKDQIQGAVSKNFGTNYEATENGFLYGYNGLADSTSVTIYSDTTTTPTTVIGKSYTDDGAHSSGGIQNFCVPIVKGNYYKATLSVSGNGQTTALYFTSLN